MCTEKEALLKNLKQGQIKVNVHLLGPPNQVSSVAQLKSTHTLTMKIVDSVSELMDVQEIRLGRSADMTL